jgi:hypothetical protein
MGKRALPILGAVGVLLLMLTASAGAQERIVAVGDIHGSYPQLARILQQTKLIGQDLQWMGGSSVLVQIGDVPSRGKQSRQCLDLLMELERQAPSQGGRVLPLLGNHEVMVMAGDLRYLMPEDFRDFAAERSEEVRDRAYSDYENFLSERDRRRLSHSQGRPSRASWRTEHPLGFFEYRDAFGPDGLYGRWLRQHDAIAQVGDVLFLHAGLSPRLKFRDIRQLNERIRSELARFDSIWKSLREKRIIWRYMTLDEAQREAREELVALESRGEARDTEAISQMQELLSISGWLLFSPDGPLWYRGYAVEPEEALAGYLDKTMSRLKVQHIVAAHTITDSRRITPRFSNRVFLIDTAMMLDGAGGRASALEILNGRFIAHYSGGKQQVLLAPAGVE